MTGKLFINFGGMPEYFNNLTQQELNNKLRPIMKGKYLPYDAKDLKNDVKHKAKYQGTDQEFVKAARKVIKDYEYVGFRVYEFGDKGKLPEMQINFWSKDGETAVSSRGVIRGFFPGDGLKAFEGKKKEFIWLKIK